jgi:hypothetical protein
LVRSGPELPKPVELVPPRISPPVAPRPARVASGRAGRPHQRRPGRLFPGPVAHPAQPALFALNLPLQVLEQPGPIPQEAFPKGFLGT